MKLKVSRSLFGSDQYNVKIQVSKKWYDFGDMNYQERVELSDIFVRFAKEIVNPSSRDGSEVKL